MTILFLPPTRKVRTTPKLLVNATLATRKLTPRTTIRPWLIQIPSLRTTVTSLRST